LGEIFSNESSRKIFTLLLEKELTIMEVSKESGISANLIIHHLRKMISSNIVSVTKETKNSRGRPLRFYRAKSAIVIASKDALNHSKPSKSLRKTLEEITRFSMIGIAGVFTWIITNSHSALESAFKYPRPILPPYMTPIEPQLGGEVFFSAIVVAGVVAAGLAINYFIPKLIPKRK
jgi:predicted transcriptional regulator